MHHFEIPFDDPEEVMTQKRDELTERLKENPDKELLRRRNVFVLWLQKNGK